MKIYLLHIYKLFKTSRSLSLETTESIIISKQYIEIIIALSCGYEATKKRKIFNHFLPRK